MAKSKEQPERVQEGLVRLYETGPKGGFIDLKEDHAKRLMDLQERMGVNDYTLQIDGSGTDKGAMEESEK